MGENCISADEIFFDALRGISRGLSVREAASFISETCDPTEASVAGCNALGALLSVYQSRHGSKALSWWKATLDSGEVNGPGSTNLLVMAAAGASGVRCDELVQSLGDSSADLLPQLVSLCAMMVDLCEPDGGCPMALLGRAHRMSYP